MRTRSCCAVTPRGATWSTPSSVSVNVRQRRANGRRRACRDSPRAWSISDHAGGGGFGDPHSRPAEKVQNDVRQGYVSVANARTLYGVALNGDTLDIDAAETERLRGG